MILMTFAESCSKVPEYFHYISFCVNLYLPKKKKKQPIPVLVLRWCYILKTIIHCIFGTTSIKKRKKSEISLWFMIFLLFLFMLRLVWWKTSYFYIYIALMGFFGHSTLFTEVNFLFFQNPVKKIPDSHEITLQHGTKTVSDDVFWTLHAFLELCQSLK